MSLSATAQGCALIETRRQLDQSEAEWLIELADFNNAELWRDDGHVCGASWLVERCKFGRATAFEKLRVAREMQRRPMLFEAMASGRVSYSQARVMSRITDGGNEFDDLMLGNAERLTTDELEMAVAHWDYLRNQDERPPDLNERRRIQRTRGFGGGMGRVIIDDWDENIDRLLNVADAAIEGNERAAARTQSPPESPRETFGPGDPIAELEPSLSMKRLDALNDLIEAAVAVHPETIDVERAAIGVTIDIDDLIAGAGSGLSSRGRAITGEAARRLACDAGIHRLITRGQSEILDIGRQTRQWNRAQRRAIKARHSHKCAVKGCHRRIVEIHHIMLWEDGGVTSIENGVPLCHSHHVMVHEGGWQVSYNTLTGETWLTSPGQPPVIGYASFTRVA